MSEAECNCDYVEIAGSRLIMRVYDGTCPVHGPDDEPDLEKVPVDDEWWPLWVYPLSEYI